MLALYQNYAGPHNAPASGERLLAFKPISGSAPGCVGDIGQNKSISPLSKIKLTICNRYVPKTGLDW